MIIFIYDDNFYACVKHKKFLLGSLNDKNLMTNPTDIHWIYCKI